MREVEFVYIVYGRCTSEIGKLLLTISLKYFLYYFVLIKRTINVEKECFYPIIKLTNSFCIS